MSFTIHNEYEPSDEMEMNLKRCISKFLYSDTDGCTQKEYETIIDKLLEIESNFYQRNKSRNDGSGLTFEERRDIKTQALKEYAIDEISRKLRKLYLRRTKHNSSDQEGDWTKCGITEDKVAKMIWKMWCDEREKRHRAGIIFVYLDALGAAEVLLTIYYKNNCPQYGYPKGKIEFGETIEDCAAREASEELGLDIQFIYDLMQDSLRIDKNIFDVCTKSSVEHSYFIIPVPSKNINFKPDKTEIADIRWHNIFTLPCCKNCQIIKQSMQSTDSSREPNYFMVTCTDQYGRHSLVQDLITYVDKINGNGAASEKYERMHRSCRHN